MNVAKFETILNMYTLINKVGKISLSTNDKPYYKKQMCQTSAPIGILEVYIVKRPTDQPTEPPTEPPTN